MATRVHGSAVVGPGVELGERVTVGPGAVVLGPAVLHDDVVVGPGAVLGTPPELTDAPQNAAWDGELEHRGIVIGPRTVVRELATVHQGSWRPTTVGADCWLLNRCYVAHDGLLGDGVTLSAGVSLGGHVTVGARATLGLGAVVHQRRSIGAGAMVAMACAVARDVPPWALVLGVPGRLHGVNAVGLRRAGIAEPAVAALTSAYTAGRSATAQPHGAPRPPGPPIPAWVPEPLRADWQAWLATSPQRPLIPLP